MILMHNCTVLDSNHAGFNDSTQKHRFHSLINWKMRNFHWKDIYSREQNIILQVILATAYMICNNNILKISSIKMTPHYRKSFEFLMKVCQFLREPMHNEND